MAFAAFLDANVLFPLYLADTLLTQAEAEAFRPLWSAGVLDELGRNLLEHTEMNEDQVHHRLTEMRAAFVDAEVTGYESLIDSMGNNPKDRHVLAAAVRGNAEVIVTSDRKGFPESSLKPFDITAVSPDDFLLDQLDLYPGLVIDCLHRQISRNTMRQMTMGELLGRLTKAGAPAFADQVRRHAV